LRHSCVSHSFRIFSDNTNIIVANDSNYLKTKQKKKKGENKAYMSNEEPATTSTYSSNSQSDGQASNDNESKLTSVREADNLLDSINDALNDSEELCVDSRSVDNEIGDTVELKEIDANELTTSSNLNSSYEQELSRLRELIGSKQDECVSLENKLNEQEQQYKQQVEQLHAGFATKLEQTLRKFQESQKDKTSSMVMKYAEAEKRCIDLNRAIELLQSKIADANKEKQRLNERLEHSKSEQTKLNADYEKKLNEMLTMKKEHDKLREQLLLNEAREKAAQLKLRIEIESHLDTRRQLEAAHVEIAQLKRAFESRDGLPVPTTVTTTVTVENVDEKESLVSKANSESDLCQTREVVACTVSNENLQQPQPNEAELAKQGSKAMKSASSSSLNISNKTSGSEATAASAPANDRTIRELYALKSQLKDMFEERSTLRDRLQCMEQERKLQEASLSKYKETLQNQKQMNKDLLNEILQLRELHETLSK
jgi:hypothetical protein